MFANFTEETATGTGATLALAGATTDHIAFSESFADGELISYALEDSGGTIKVAGVGTYVSATDDITRNDTWNWNGTVVDKNPSTNIALSGGTHTIRCANAERDSGAQPPVGTWLYDSSYYDYPDNLGMNSVITDTVVANRCTYGASWLQRPRLITNLSIQVVTADDTATLSKAGIYTCKLDGSVGKLIESVSIDVTTTGGKVAALSSPLSLPAGWYYFAFASDGTPSIKTTHLSERTAAPTGYRSGTPRQYNPYETLSSWTDLPANATALNGENYAPIVFWN